MPVPEKRVKKGSKIPEKRVKDSLKSFCANISCCAAAQYRV